MIEMNLADAARLMDGRLDGEDRAFTGVSTDSRALVEGGLFFALRGPNFDGHDFAAAAREAGAAAVVADHALPGVAPCILVDDTVAALGRLASAWRRSLDCHVVGVTGSNGKTTVKEMLGAILGRLGPTAATRGNLNNHIGVPLTLLDLSPADRYAVVEMGANAEGEIAVLTRLASPDVAVVTNTGAAHLAGFGGHDGVIRAKGEIYAGLGERGVAVINADDTSAAAFRALNRNRCTIEFGLQAGADVQGRWSPEGGVNRLWMTTPVGELAVHLALPGRHNAANALAATACALALDVDLETVRAGLMAVEPVAGRLQDRPGAGEAHLLDDTYNANPDSLVAGLTVLAARPEEGWLVLGDMGELGADAAELHADAGETARALGVTRLFTVGELSRRASERFGAGAEHFDSIAGLVAALRPQLSPGVCVLVKGSRAMGMERVVRGLEEGPADAV